jgi:RNA polymerase sigma-70 factor (ECF subfamily)
MPSSSRLPSLTSATTDADLAARSARGDQAAFETVMRRHNTRLFRVARSILKNEEEAEDALQEAYLHAYRQIGDFRGSAQLRTWLTRIVINQALTRVRKLKRDQVLVSFEAGRATDARETDMPDTTGESPSDAALRAETRQLLERRIDELPLAFRTVFVMREVEEMTVEETAECLEIPQATVRTRLFRARAILRERLSRDLDVAATQVFGFAGDRCDRIVAGVLTRLRAKS